LNQQLHVPVGLINTSWGGTPAEVWAPKASIENNETLKTAAAKLESYAWWPSEPGATYNAMVAPIQILILQVQYGTREKAIPAPMQPTDSY
jgi:sialate O-acetylesterase